MLAQRQYIQAEGQRGNTFYIISTLSRKKLSTVNVRLISIQRRYDLQKIILKQVKLVWDFPQPVRASKQVLDLYSSISWPSLVAG